MRRPILLLASSILVSAALCRLNERFWQRYEYHDPSLLLIILMDLIVPLAAAALPTSALVWLAMVVTRPWHGGKALRVWSLGLPIAAMLYLSGPWVRNIYDLEPNPPFALRRLAGAMQGVGFMMPFIIAAWLGGISLAHRRRRLGA